MNANFGEIFLVVVIVIVIFGIGHLGDLGETIGRMRRRAAGPDKAIDVTPATSPPTTRPTEAQDIHGPMEDAELVSGEADKEAPLSEDLPQSEAGPTDPVELLQEALRRTNALAEVSMRAPIVGALLSSCSAGVAAFVLDQLVRMTVTGREDGAITLLAAVAWRLRDEHAYEWQRSVYEAAAEAALECAPLFLLDLPPRRQVANARGLRQPRFDRDVTLGERKQLARGRDRAMLDRLLLDTDPSVIEKLCQNPGVTRQDILSVVTRRPNLPAILREVALSWRWLVDYEVRLALVFNPYVETGLALKLLPFLHGSDIRKVARSGELHSALTQYATRLLVIRSARSLAP